MVKTKKPGGIFQSSGMQNLKQEIKNFADMIKEEEKDS